MVKRRRTDEVPGRRSRDGYSMNLYVLESGDLVWMT